ncbi:MAG: glycerol dehydrogenase [Spirochaetota bacterium]|nr:MAG: glycerol dehydrogenase [Spirochaetota bacterium]
MIRSSIFPGRYIQGGGALDVLGDEIKRFGSNALFILTRYAYQNLLEEMKQKVGGKIEAHFEPFGGECSDEEIERITGIAKDKKANVVAGVGGGKAIDTAKITAYNISSPIVIVPTIASTDAPCSANSVIYTEDEEFKRYFMLPKNPDAVIVDTAVIAKAPVRFLISGMGDALATRFEAESCIQKNADNLTGYKGTLTAGRLASLCYEIIVTHGLKAKTSCESDLVSEALEHVVEANTLLSGLGFESVGLAAAHAIHNGLTVNSKTSNFFHGELVAVGTLASLFLTDKPKSLIDEVYGFCLSVGLPVTLGDIGLEKISDSDLMKIAEASCKEGETIYNEPVPITTEKLFDALREADRYGAYLRKNNQTRIDNS